MMCTVTSDFELRIIHCHDVERVGIQKWKCVLHCFPSYELRSRIERMLCLSRVSCRRICLCLQDSCVTSSPSMLQSVHILATSQQVHCKTFTDSPSTGLDVGVRYPTIQTVSRWAALIGKFYVFSAGYNSPPTYDVLLCFVWHKRSPFSL